MIVRELNKIIVEHNGLRFAINFAAFDFEIVGEKIVILDNDEVVLILNGSQELLNELYAAINIKGKKGDKGAKGDKGDKGDKGEQGAKGDKGDTGQSGNDGKDGRDGKDGEKGERGEKGDTGEKGQRGEDGKDGEKGAKGDKGDRGERGLNGIDGKDGIDGKNGTNGKDGKNGKDGEGQIWRGEYVLGQDYKKNDIVRTEKTLFIAIVDTDNNPITTEGDLNKDWDVYLKDGKDGRNGRNGIDGGGVGADVKVKVSSNDTTNGYLEEKIISGNDIILEVVNEGANEKIRINADLFPTIWAVNTLINC